MGKYYHRRYYQGNSIKSFWDLFMWFVQIGLLLALLFLLPYILPAYTYIVEHPISLIPVGICVLCMIGLVYYLREKRKETRMRAMTRFSEVMKLDWREFEQFIADVLKQKWFHILLWVGIKDGGVDVTATLGNKKFFVQCKHYGNKNISVEKIRELHGVMMGGIIPAWGIFVTTTWFTPDAVSEAKKYGIDLWDKNYIIEYLKWENISTEKEHANCELCGGKLILRTAHSWPHTWGQFFWCENFPKCHFIKNI